MTSIDLLVLHTLRCIGTAGLDRIAEASGHDRVDVESELIDLAVSGLVTHDSGSFGGWSVTAEGKAADAERISAELDAAGARDVVTRAYEEFLPLNPELLDICTAWQMERNERALEALTDFHRRTGVVWEMLTPVLSRFCRHESRLAHALARVGSGAHEYVTDDLASYHAVWFQLHEDLLATLGIPRT